MVQTDAPPAEARILRKSRTDKYFFHGDGLAFHLVYRFGWTSGPNLVPLSFQAAPELKPQSAAAKDRLGLAVAQAQRNVPWQRFLQAWQHRFDQAALRVTFHELADFENGSATSARSAAERQRNAVRTEVIWHDYFPRIFSAFGRGSSLLNRLNAGPAFESSTNR